MKKKKKRKITGNGVKCPYVVMPPVTELPVFHPCEVSQVEADLLAVFLFQGKPKDKYEDMYSHLYTPISQIPPVSSVERSSVNIVMQLQINHKSCVLSFGYFKLICLL